MENQSRLWLDWAIWGKGWETWPRAQWWAADVHHADGRRFLKAKRSDGGGVFQQLGCGDWSASRKSTEQSAEIHLMKNWSGVLRTADGPAVILTWTCSIIFEETWKYLLMIPSQADRAGEYLQRRMSEYPHVLKTGGCNCCQRCFSVALAWNTNVKVLFSFIFSI